jgi:hypothetical protein
MTWSRIVLLALVVSLALPVAMFKSPPRGVPGIAPNALAASSAPAMDPGQPVLAKGAKKRTRDARGQPARSKAAARPPKDDRGAAKATSAPTRRERKEADCGPGLIKLSPSGLCTHGPDPAPPGVDITKRAEPLKNSAARALSAKSVCEGNGQSGNRVQVLYVRAADVPSHFDAYRESFRGWAATVDDILRRSAADAGGGRQVRFVTTPAPSCQIDVSQVVLSPSGDDTFAASVDQLKARGYDREDRIYLIFVDTASAGICGIGNLARDDDPSQANWNNFGPSYSRVDAGCWDYAVAPAHELMHNLGAVQNSAPNSSQGGHCIDEYDVMCYSDEPFFPEMRDDCPDSAMEVRLDCNHNDYFHPDPPPGSYLANHWNTADNQFLVDTETPAIDTEPPTVTWVSPVGNRDIHTASDGVVQLEVEVTDNVGVTQVLIERYDPVRERDFFLSSDWAAPYTASVDVDDLQPGYNYIQAVAYDAMMNTNYDYFWVYNERSTPAPDPEPEPPATAATLTITAPSARAKLKAGANVSIQATLTNATGSGVEVRQCASNPCSWRTATVIGADTSAPYSVAWKAPKSGSITLVARANDADQTLSDPVQVSVKKAKKKKKKRR